VILVMSWLRKARLHIEVKLGIKEKVENICSVEEAAVSYCNIVLYKVTPQTYDVSTLCLRNEPSTTIYPHNLLACTKNR